MRKRLNTSQHFQRKTRQLSLPSSPRRNLKFPQSPRKMSLSIPKPLWKQRSTAQKLLYTLLKVPSPKASSFALKKPIRKIS